ncbi:hypothetical protein EHI8A_215170 [Entamoeba histolytica HM-1:IMSS-B]|nr:hypothetical protein EHI8A_215170 [Entamoeba histolytica HM-1:IMSS-B]GAT92321.1 hypothetical protein CL6EHI_023100 [Entamoeba histolytica]
MKVPTISEDVKYLNDKKINKINRKFKVSEQFSHEFKCSLNSVFGAGRLYVGTHHLCFSYLKIIKKKHVIMAWNEMSDINKINGKCIEIRTKNGMFILIYCSSKVNELFDSLMESWRRSIIFSEKLKQITKRQKNETIDKNSNDEGILKEEPKHVVTIHRFHKSANDLFMLVFSNNETVKQLFDNIGQKEVKTEGWQNEANGGKILYLSYKGVSSVIGMETRIEEKWEMRMNENGIMIAMVVSVFDIPYSSYFKIESLMKMKDEGEYCDIVVKLNVKFMKSTIWKNRIEQTTMKEYKNKYEEWMKLIGKMIGDSQFEETEEYNSIKQKSIDKKKVIYGMIILITICIVCCLLYLLIKILH